jgi:hypothetical protein
MASHDTMVLPTTRPSLVVGLGGTPSATVLVPKGHEASVTAGPTPASVVRCSSWRRRRRSGFTYNDRDPERGAARSRCDHNRVRDVPFSVSVLGLAPPPPPGRED